MKGTQEHFGNTEIRRARKGKCCRFVGDGSEICGNSAYLVIFQDHVMAKKYCKMHAKDSWLNEVK